MQTIEDQGFYDPWSIFLVSRKVMDPLWYSCRAHKIVTTQIKQGALNISALRQNYFRQTFAPGALYGNKKLLEFNFPEKEMQIMINATRSQQSVCPKGSNSSTAMELGLRSLFV